MKYFILKQHKQYTDAPVILNWYNKIDVRDIDKAKAQKLPHRTLLNIQNNPHTIFPSIISEPFFLVSQETRDAISLYDQTIKFKQVVLLDTANSLIELYFLPVFEKVTCLAKGCILNRNRSIIFDAILNKNCMQDRSVFQIGDANGTHVVARLDLVESILRRNAKGVFLQPVTLCEE